MKNLILEKSSTYKEWMIWWEIKSTLSSVSYNFKRNQDLIAPKINTKLWKKKPEAKKLIFVKLQWILHIKLCIKNIETIWGDWKKKCKIALILK